MSSSSGKQIKDLISDAVRDLIQTDNCETICFSPNVLFLEDHVSFVKLTDVFSLHFGSF